MLDTKNPIYRITVMGEEIPIVPSDFVIPEPTPPAPPAPEEPDTDYDQNYRTIIHSLSTPVTENGWVYSATVVEAISAVFDENLFKGTHSTGTNLLSMLLDIWHGDEKLKFESYGFVLETFRHQTNVTFEDGTTRLVNIYDEKNLTTPPTVRNVGYVLNGQIVDYETLYNRPDWLMFFYTTVVIKNTDNTVDMYLYICALESGVYTSADGLITLNLDTNTNPPNVNFSNMNEYAGQVFSFSLYPGMIYDPETGEEYLGATAYVWDNNLGSLEFRFKLTGFNQLSYKGTPLTKTGDIQVATPVSFSWDIDSSKFAFYNVIDPQTGMGVSEVTPGRMYNVDFSTHAGFYAESLTIDGVQYAFWDAGGISSTTVSFTAPSNNFTIGVYLVASSGQTTFNSFSSTNLNSMELSEPYVSEPGAWVHLASDNLNSVQLNVGQEYRVSMDVSAGYAITNVLYNGSSIWSGHHTNNDGLLFIQFYAADNAVFDVITEAAGPRQFMTNIVTTHWEDEQMPSFYLLENGSSLSLGTPTEEITYNSYYAKNLITKRYSIAFNENSLYEIHATPNTNTNMVFINGLDNYFDATKLTENVTDIQSYQFSVNEYALNSPPSYTPEIHISEQAIEPATLQMIPMDDYSGAGYGVDIYDINGNFLGEASGMSPAMLMHNTTYIAKPHVNSGAIFTELRYNNEILSQPFTSNPEVQFTYAYGKPFYLAYAQPTQTYTVNINGSAFVRATLLDGTPVELTNIMRHVHYNLYITITGGNNKISRVTLGNRELYIASDITESSITIPNIIFGEFYWSNETGTIEYFDDTLTVEGSFDPNAPINYSTEYDTNAINSVDILALDGSYPAEYYPNSPYRVAPNVNDGFVLTSIQVDGNEIYHYDQASGTATGDTIFTPTTNFTVTIVTEAVSTTTTNTFNYTAADINSLELHEPYMGEWGFPEYRLLANSNFNNTQLTSGTEYQMRLGAIEGKEIREIVYNGETLWSGTKTNQDGPLFFTFTAVANGVLTITTADQSPGITINFDYDSSLGTVHLTDTQGNIVTEYTKNTDYVLVVNPNYGYYMYSAYSLEGGQREYTNYSTFNSGSTSVLNITIFIKPEGE